MNIISLGDVFSPSRSRSALRRRQRGGESEEPEKQENEVTSQYFICSLFVQHFASSPLISFAQASFGISTFAFRKT
jgi:hypothetical protein